MSYLSELRLINSIYNNSEIKNNTISTESIVFKKSIDFVKQLIKKVIEYAKRIFAWIKNKVFKWFDSKEFKNRIKRIQGLYSSPIIDLYLRKNSLESVVKRIVANKYKHDDITFSLESIKEEDSIEVIIEKIIEAFRNYNPKLLGNIFKSDGTLFNIDELIKNSDDKINFIRTEFARISNNKYVVNKTDLLHFYNLVTTNDSYIYSRTNGVSDVSEIKINSKQELYKYIVNFDEAYQKVNDYYKDAEKKINVALNALQSEINATPDTGNVLINKLRMLRLEALNVSLVIVSNPLNTLLFYVRLLQLVDQDILKEVDITVNKVNYKHLYHISNNPRLCGTTDVGSIGLMKPRLPDNGTNEFLPPRCCFSESIKGCILATTYISNNLSGIKTHRFYLYEGIPDNNSKFIDPVILHHQTKDGYLTEEVALTTSTKIRKLGMVEVTINHDVNVNNLGWFISEKIIAI